MNTNNLKTLAITGILIGLGTFALHGAMAFAQSSTYRTDIKQDLQDTKSSNDRFFPAKTSDGVKETELDGKNVIPDTYNWNAFTIDLITYEGETPKRKPEDMKPEKALEIGLNKIEKIYKINLHGNTVKILFNKVVERDNYNNSKNVNVRYYEGYIHCSETLDYGFEVNSVTGEILAISKINSEETDFNNKSIIYDMYTKEDLAKVKDEYYKLAKNFVNKYVDKGNVTKMYGLCPGSVQHRYSMYAYCETSEGDTIYIAIDQVTKEVLSYKVNPAYM